jgi:predicted metal-dependent hydrolase
VIRANELAQAPDRVTVGFWTALFSPPALPKSIPRAPAPRAAINSVAEQARRSSSGIDYKLERARRKSIGLIITTEGLLIRAPKWTPLYEIDAAIAERNAWIVAALARQSGRRAQLAAYRDGGHVLFRGIKLKVEVRQGLFDSIDLTESHCIATTLNGAFNADAFDEELKRIARLELPEMARSMAREAELPLASVTLSSARTMWGSCTSTGRVRLNFRLLQLAPELMRHVVAHELAHLVEFNHSKRFWAIVERLDPNTKAHKRAIKGYSVLLEL